MSAHRFHIAAAGLLALALTWGETGRVNATPLDPNAFQAKAMANGAFPWIEAKSFCQLIEGSGGIVA